MEPEQNQNPFQRIDETLESYKQDAGTGRKLAKRAESVLRGARKTEADLLKPDRISDRAFEAQTMPPRQRWIATSGSLADKIEKVSVRLGESGLDETEKTALWSRFKNMVRYKEKIDAALKKGMTDEVDRELAEDPLHVYARGLNEVEDEVLKHKEREASEIKAQADKLESTLAEYRMIDKHVEELERPRDTEKEDKILELNIELAAKFMEKLDTARLLIKRIKDWVDGLPDGQGLDSKSISECVAQLERLHKGWSKFEKRKKDSLPREESDLMELRYKTENSALNKRFALDFDSREGSFATEVYREAKKLSHDGVLHFDDDEMREIELLAFIARFNIEENLSALRKGGKYTLNEEEAKIITARWPEAIYENNGNYDVSLIIPIWWKYGSRKWYKALKRLSYYQNH